MEWIKKILDKAVYGEDGKLDVEATTKLVNEEAFKHIVPKEQYNGKVKELDAANVTLKEIKKGNEDNETLQNSVKTYEGQIKEMEKAHKAEITGMKVDAAIGDLLSSSKAKYPELLATKIDRSKISVGEDGKVIGASEQIESLKGAYKDMFGATIEGNDPTNPDTPPTGNSYDTLVKNADNLTVEQAAAQFAEMNKK